MIVKVLMNSISTTKNSTYEVCACMLSRLSLCNPKNYSLLGSSVHRIFQARMLEWVAISYSRGIFLTQESNLHLLITYIGRWNIYH